MLLSDVYALYNTPHEALLRKTENWKRYRAYCVKHRLPKGTASEQRFKFSKHFLKPVPQNRLWFFLSHIPTKDLYYILSVCRDKANRGESVGSYIIGATRPPVDK